MSHLGSINYRVWSQGPTLSHLASLNCQMRFRPALSYKDTPTGDIPKSLEITSQEPGIRLDPSSGKAKFLTIRHITVK